MTLYDSTILDDRTRLDEHIIYSNSCWRKTKVVLVKVVS